MTNITPGVSLLGSSDAQTGRLNAMRRKMDDLVRQMGTQKKYDTLSGFGLGAQTVLQLHADSDQLQAYSDNIDAATRNMTTMSDSMGKITDAVNKLVSALQSQPQNGQFDVTLIGNLAQQTLTFISDVANLNISGRYLFAGTDSQTAPVASLNTLNANLQTEITNWLSGANTTNQAIANVGALSGTNLGFSPTLSSARNLDVRIDDATEITYGAIADRCGMQDVLRAIGLMANLRPPNPATDVPTNVQFGQLIDYVTGVARDAVAEIQSSQGAMSGTLSLAGNVQETHKQDINLFTAQMAKLEDADATDVITQLQALQTQLTSSYQATRIVSQMSLANFL